MTGHPLEPTPRVSLTLEEAAQSLGVSLSTFKRHVLPRVKIVRAGSCRTVGVAELRRYVEREAK